MLSDGFGKHLLESVKMKLLEFIRWRKKGILAVM